MKKVFLLHHLHDVADGSEDVKLIGIYSSKKKAQKATAMLSKQVGFKDSIDGFHIEKYEIDKDHWLEGFVMVTD